MRRIVVDNSYARLYGDWNRFFFDAVASYKVHGAWFSQAHRNGTWDGRKRFYRKTSAGWYKMPSGFVDELTALLDEQEIGYELEDNRDFLCAEPVYQLGTKILNKGPRDYQGEIVDAAISTNGGVIQAFTGAGKCLGLGERVVLYDGTLKKVEDLAVGDKLLGPDSEPRVVTSTCRGSSELFRIKPVRGRSWVCNDVHILTLKHTSNGSVIDVPLNEYLAWSESQRHPWKLFQPGVVRFQERAAPEVDPYFLGLWHGDGTKALNGVHLTFLDLELVSFLREYAPSVGCVVSERAYEGKCPGWALVTPPGPNSLLRTMQRILRVDGEIVVPDSILYGSVDVRSKWLAGILDTDGYRSRSTISIVQKSKNIADAVVFIARSLGFRVVESIKQVPGYSTDYYRASITGDFSILPMRVTRKICPIRRQRKDPKRFGFSVTSIGNGDYAGFTLTGDGRFLLENFQVTHNTVCGAAITASFDAPTLFLTHRVALLHQTHKAFEDLLGQPVGLIGDGECRFERYNIGMVQTLKHAKFAQFLKSVRVLICDEVHHLESDSWMKVVGACGAVHRYGLSATPSFRGPGRALIGYTGPVIYQISPTEGIDRGVLVPPEIYYVDYDQEQIDCSSRAAFTRGVSQSVKRTEATVRISKMLVAADHRPMVLFRYLNHMQVLKRAMEAKGLKVGVVEGKTKNREEVINDLLNGEIDVLLGQVSIMGEGIDIPELSAIVNATGMRGGGSSSSANEAEVGRLTMQILGRGLRSAPLKEKCYYIDFNDTSHPALQTATDDRKEALRDYGFGPYFRGWSDFLV